MTAALSTLSRTREAPGTGAFARGYRTIPYLLLPAMAFLVAMVLLPSLFAILASFTDYRLGEGGPRFVGLQNYADLVASPAVRNSVMNTSIYMAVVIPTSLTLGLGFALLIRARRWSGPIYRAIYFLPATAAIVAMATVWQFIYLPGVGLANQIFGLLGFGPVNLLYVPSTALYAIAFIGVWQETAIQTVLFSAGLTTVRQDLHDAARVDGAENAWTRFWLVTWPALRPTTVFAVTICALRTLQTFESVLLLTQGGPANATEVLFHTLYLEGFRYFRIGFASALSVVVLALVSVLMIVQIRNQDRRSHVR